MHEGAVSAALGIKGIPTIAESTMVARDAALAGYEDARVHFQHLSCAASVDAVADAKARGWRVTELRRRSPARRQPRDAAPRLRSWHHALRPGQQLRPAIRQRGDQLRAGTGRGPSPLP